MSTEDDFDLDQTDRVREEVERLRAGHNAGVALDHLRKLYPEGPWVLTAIEVDGPALHTESCADEAHVITFLKQHDKRNIYYDLNKLGSHRIDAVHYFHVDLNPNPGEDLTIAQERLHQLTLDPPTNIPSPTASIYSGGGYQLLWALEAPIEVGGELSIAEDAKRYNRAIQHAYGAEDCHNVDRIMRLPGTINWPQARKRTRGQGITRARLEWFETGRRYPITEFTQAPIVQTQTTTGFGSVPGSKSSTVPRVSGNIPRLGSVHDLPVSEKMKILIVQGRDPDDLISTDRTPIITDVCRALVRAGVSDSLIYSILTDPEFKISAHVIAQGSGKERYALRAIERAKEYAFDPLLLELNERHAVVENFGGRCRVLEEQYDLVLQRSGLTFQSFEDFKNRYLNRYVPCGTDKKGNPIDVALGKWWLGQSARRQYRTITFAPGREIEDVYNLWRGFAVEPRPGSKHLKFIDHIREDLCANNQELLDYLLNWMALTIQKPDAPGQVAIVMRGRKGTGKCLGIGTKVLKYDGTLINVEDVQVGDQLMGPDSQPRNVLNTTRGSGQLYRVVPVKGEPWVCNDAHVLTLVSWETGELIDVPVEDYMESNLRFRRLHFQVFTCVDFPVNPEPLPIDPYFLGVWFGDGTKNLMSVTVTNIDPEVRDACAVEAKRWGLLLTAFLSDHGVPHFRLAAKWGGGNNKTKNPLLNTLRKLVTKAVIIPPAYLRASREDRLSFLAGLIDSDGHLSCGGFEFTQKRKDYVEAVMFLGRSLGFQVTARPKIVNGAVYWRAFISGDCSVIPTRLPHKRAHVRRHVKDVTRTGIVIENAGIGEYAGFSVDGDNRFLLGDFTVTHNSFFARTFGRIFGRHYLAVSNAKHLVGQFNAHLRDCVLLFGDEAFWAGDKAHESVLKALITEDTIMIEQKTIDVEPASNFVHLIMASNEQWVVPASYDERRFLVLDVSAAHMQDTKYFGEIDADLKGGGLSHLLHALQTRDLSNFNVRTVPNTEALLDQKVHSMTSNEEWWFRKLSDGVLAPMHTGWESPITKDALIDDYLTYAQRLGQGKRASSTALSKFLERCVPGLHSFHATHRGRDDNGDPVIGRALFWQFPSLDACREEFGKKCGGPFNWPGIEVRDKAAAAPDPGQAAVEKPPQSSIPF